MKKENLKNENEAIKRKILSVSGVPSEVILGVPIVTIIGCQEFLIMNYRGILEYTDTIVRIQTKTGQIKITGKSMIVDFYTNEEMKISGRIIKIEYV